MPERWRVCNHPGCPDLVTTPRCPTHTRATRRDQAAQRRSNGDEAMSVYTTQAWRNVRAQVLRDQPTCNHCGGEAQHVDHIAPRRLLVAAGTTDPDNPLWLQPLCDRCHNTKTARVDTPLLKRWRNGEHPADLINETLSG